MFIEYRGEGERGRAWPTWHQYADLKPDGSIVWDRLPYISGLTDNESIGPLYVVLPNQQEAKAQEEKATKD